MKPFARMVRWVRESNAIKDDSRSTVKLNKALTERVIRVVALLDSSAQIRRGDHYCLSRSEPLGDFSETQRGKLGHWLNLTHFQLSAD